MPTMRIELEVADRAEAQRIVHASGAAGTGPSDDAVLAEVERRGRTASGGPECAGMTNGRPVLLKFDVEVYPET
ncbi:hypothetical protein [Isoptericola nanjingensis]|uniref:hypothetical protein n=1 Tax=Isoptericola TaxID=254250 RepID=UPI0035EEEE3B